MSPPTPANPAAAWWADDLALADGAAVSSWTDRATSKVVSQSNSARCPVFDVDGLNGRPCVNFQGGEHHLILNATNALSTATQGCMVAVVNPTSLASARPLWASSSTSTTGYRLGVNVPQSGKLSVLKRPAISPAFDDQVDSAASLFTGPQILEVSTNGSVYTMRINNVAQSLTVAQGLNRGEWFGDTANRVNFAMGGLVRTTIWTAGFLGSIAYIAFFNAPLSNVDRADLYGWLIGYYFGAPYYSWNGGNHWGTNSSSTKGRSGRWSGPF